MTAVKEKIKVDEKDVVKEDAYLEDLASPYFKFKSFSSSKKKKKNSDEGLSAVIEEKFDISQSINEMPLRTKS